MDRSTRIAFISEHASPISLLGGADAGGQNVYVDEVTRHLAQRGYTIDIFTRRDSVETAEIIHWSSGVRVIHLTAGPQQRCPKDELWPFMPEFLVSFLDFMIRDEVHYDLIHANFWMSGWVATRLQQRLNIPAIQIFHATGKTKRRHQKKVDTSPGDRIATEMSIVQDMTHLIAQCPCERDELIYDYKANPCKVSIIPSAVNTQVFRPVPRQEARRHISIDQNEKVIVYVGRMVPRKDIRNIVRAVALLLREHGRTTRLPVTLLMVGGETLEPDPLATPEIGELQKLASQLGILDHVRFVGKRQASELRDYYSAGDVAVTTPWYEPFGLTPLEAMACGRPVIGSAVGGLTYTIKDGETGFLVPPHGPEALASRLQQLLDNPEQCIKMGCAARRRIEREFTWSMVALRTSKLYETVLAEQRIMRETVPSFITSIPSETNPWQRLEIE